MCLQINDKLSKRAAVSIALISSQYNPMKHVHTHCTTQRMNNLLAVTQATDQADEVFNATPMCALKETDFVTAGSPWCFQGDLLG